MKKIVKQLFGICGFDIRRVNVKKDDIIEIGSDKRPVGSMKFLLEDLKKRGLKCKTILDVGANNTLYSRMVKKIFPEAGFCLIEPQLEMKIHLENFCEEYNDSVYFLAGAGAKKEIMTLTIWEDFYGSSLIPKPNDKLKNEGKQREIEIIAIDDLIASAKINLPELVKLDIQGFELEALKGATKTFGYTEVYILEVSLFPDKEAPEMPVLSDVINFMLERDYVVYDFPGFLRRPFDGALGQCDICFVKKDGFLRTFNSWN